MNGVAATQAEERTITKPPEWAVYMVTAALKCAFDEKLPTTHASHDEAKYSILRSLNWFEAHDEYEWPGFTGFNYDFSQVMRLRRALVQDIFNALERAGNVNISIAGTPDSNAGKRGRRPDGAGRRSANNRKRLCKREAETDEDAISEAADERHQDDAFLLAVMTDLISRSRVDVAAYMHDKDKKDSQELANMLHDSLVDVWTEPRQADGEQVAMLKQKADVWERHKRSLPPPSSQRERTATPHTSPHSVQKSKFEPTSANAGGFTAANRHWPQTHTLG